MTTIRAHAFTISLDGYGAGPQQSLANPLGVGGRSLHEFGTAKAAHYILAKHA